MPILVKRFAPPYDRSQRRSAEGYVHSIVVHPDGMGEDARGIVPIIDIAGRFGAIESDVCEETHEEVIANYLLTSREMYESELKLARSLIK